MTSFSVARTAEPGDQKLLPGSRGGDRLTSRSLLFDASCHQRSQMITEVIGRVAKSDGRSNRRTPRTPSARRSSVSRQCRPDAVEALDRVGRYEVAFASTARGARGGGAGYCTHLRFQVAISPTVPGARETKRKRAGVGAKHGLGVPRPARTRAPMQQTCRTGQTQCVPRLPSQAGGRKGSGWAFWGYYSRRTPGDRQTDRPDAKRLLWRLRAVPARQWSSTGPMAWTVVRWCLQCGRSRLEVERA